MTDLLTYPPLCLVPIAAAETTTAAAKGYDVIFEPDANPVCGVSQFSPYLLPHT
jgi:hypothetical protein